MKCDAPTPETDQLLDGCLAEALSLLSYRVCFRILPLERQNEGLVLGTLHTDSADLKKSLDGCSFALLLAATVGLPLDRAIARYGHTAPSRALCLQAIGAERIEALCDAFVAQQKEILAAKGLSLRPRFSPGYGDLPLFAQRALFEILSPAKHIGLTLTEDMLMSPTKSVTAIAGIEVLS